MNEPKRIYNGAFFCGTAGCGCGCPVVDYDSVSEMVSVSDPAKPENGTFRMTRVEWNALIQNAKPIN